MQPNKPAPSDSRRGVWLGAQAPQAVADQAPDADHRVAPDALQPLLQLQDPLLEVAVALVELAVALVDLPEPFPQADQGVAFQQREVVAFGDRRRDTRLLTLARLDPMSPSSSSTQKPALVASWTISAGE